MKLEIKKQILLKILKKINSMVIDSIINPIFEYLYVEVYEKKVSFLFKNNYFEYIYNINDQNEFKTDEDFNFLIKASLFKNIIEKSNTETIKIIKNLDNNIEVSYNNFKCLLNTLNDAKFPIINFDLKELKILNLTKDRLLKITKYITPFAGINNIKKIINGINFNKTDSVLNITTTDSFKISNIKYNIENEENFNFTIPTKSFSIFYNNFITNETVLTMYINENDNTIILNINNDEYIKIKTINGIYPDLSKALATKNNLEFTINKNLLINAIERASLLEHNQKIWVLNLEFNNDKLKISTESYTSGWSQEILDIESLNINILLKVNGDFILSLLKVIESENIKFQINDKNSPIIILSDIHELKQILLPIRS